MTDESEFGYIRDLAYFLREELQEIASLPHSELRDSRELAMREVLSRMQNQADAFDIDRRKVCLHGFDPMVDAVLPSVPWISTYRETAG